MALSLVAIMMSYYTTSVKDHSGAPYKKQRLSDGNMDYGCLDSFPSLGRVVTQDPHENHSGSVVFDVGPGREFCTQCFEERLLDFHGKDLSSRKAYYIR